MKKQVALLCASILVFALSIHTLIAENETRGQISADEFIVSEVGTLIREGNDQGALDAVKKLLEQFPGDPLLKRYQGILLDRLGNSNEAISIFKALLQNNPKHVPTHYFLAQAYSRSGNQSEAIQEWTWITDQQEQSVYTSWAQTGLVRAGAYKGKGVLPRRQKTRPWHLHARYGYEYDSNVTIAPTDDALRRDGDQNAGRQLLSLALRYRPYATQDATWDIHYGARQTFHDDGLDEFNFHSEEIGTELKKRIKIGNQDVVAGLRYDLLLGLLDGDLFSARNRWQISGDTRFTPRTRTFLFDRMTVSNFGPDGTTPSDTSRDGFYNDFGIINYWYTRDFAHNFFIKQEFNSSHTRGDNFDTIGTTTRIGTRTRLMDRLSMDVSSGLELGIFHNFSSTSPLDTARRRDVMWDLYSALTYELHSNLHLRTFYRYINQENQNDIFDYTRHLGGFQFIYNFDF